MTPEAAQGTSKDAPAISALALGTLVLSQYRIVLSAVLTTFVAATIFWLVEAQWQARSTFASETASSATSRLAGLAAQFGIDAGAGAGGESVTFYLAVLRSRELLSRAVESKYVVAVKGSDTTFKTLIEIYSPKSPSVEGKLFSAIATLNDDLAITPEASGLVAIEVAAPTRDLAIQINRRLHVLLNEFNLTRRQTRATAEREFVEGRMKQAQQELAEAEGKLAAFLQTNVQYQQSPRLVLDYASLQRLIDVRQQVFLSLSQAYEQARIAEVRDTPVITMIDPPELEYGRSLNIFLLWLAALPLGLVIGVVVVLIREFLARSTSGNPAEYEEFREQLRRVAAALAPRALLAQARGLTKRST